MNAKDRTVSTVTVTSSAAAAVPTVNFTIFAKRYVLSCVAASISETITYPLDLTKMRLQIQGESARYRMEGGVISPYRGMVRTAVGIVEEEGFLKLWQGVTPAIARHIVYTGFRMGFYEYLRDHIFGRNSDGTFPVWKAVCGGLASGAMSQFMASPMDLLKILLQAEGRRRLEGQPPRVRGPAHAFTIIMKENGVRGLWRGWVPNVQRAALVNMGDLTTYDTAKHFLLRHTHLQDNILLHFMSSACAGLVAALLATPMDVVKTRIMSSSMSTDPQHARLYKSSIDCLVKTVEEEGFMALYKGFIPAWSRMAPWSLIFWLSYEQIRALSGVSSF